jgi:hypothetical protein
VFEDSIEFADRTWKVFITGSSDYISEREGVLPVVVLVIILFLTVVLFVYLAFNLYSHKEDFMDSDGDVDMDIHT